MFNSNKAVFITAVGTPLDDKGRLIEKSFRKHLNDQIKNGIDGLLIMGSMGMMPCLSPETYIRCAEIATGLKEIKAAFSKDDFEEITRIQDKMTWLRDEFIKIGVFPAFTEAMNLLGFEGNFHPSHICPLDNSIRSKVKRLLKEAGLL